MKNDPRRSFWRAAGPLLGFWGIQLVMEFVIEFIIILPFMGEASSRMTQSGEVLNYQEMMNKYYEVLSPAFDKIIGGQIAIAGIATAATLFLTVTLFVIEHPAYYLLLHSAMHLHDHMLREYPSDSAPI